MTKPTVCLTIPLLALLLCCAPAQTLIGLDCTLGPTVMDEMTCLSPAYPTFQVPVGPIPMSGALVPSGPPLGAVTMDNTTGLIYATNGTTIEVTAYPGYPVTTPVPAPFPTPAIIGPVTAMALDPVNGVLYCTDGLTFVGVSPVAGTPLISMWGTSGLVAGPITGMDWDPYAGLLWATDAGGNVYHVIPGISMPAPLVIPAPFPFATSPATGLAIDKSVAGGPAPSGGVYVAFSSSLVLEYLNNLPGPGFPIGLAFTNGLTYHALPAPVYGGTPCGGSIPSLLPTGAAYAGNLGFGLSVNAAPGAAMLLAFDGVPAALLPNGLSINGGALYLDPFFSPTFAVLPLGPSSGSPLNLTVPLPPTSSGLSVVVQVIAGCGGPNLGLSDARQVIVGRP